VRLDIAYTISSEGAGTIEINDQDYLNWCRTRPYLDTHSDKELLRRESAIRFYLNSELGPEKISNLVGWGEEIGDVWDVDILES
jgi:hypothetical protein